MFSGQVRSKVLAGGAVVAALALGACGGSSGGGNGGGDGGNDSSSPSSGKAIFASVGCKSCHTLGAADAHGQVGPNLDDLKPSEAAVVKQVTDGGGGMPAFKGQLSGAQIQAVAKYVHDVAGQ